VILRQAMTAAAHPRRRRLLVGCPEIVFDIFAIGAP